MEDRVAAQLLSPIAMNDLETKNVIARKEVGEMPLTRNEDLAARGVEGDVFEMEERCPLEIGHLHIDALREGQIGATQSMHQELPGIGVSHFGDLSGRHEFTWVIRPSPSNLSNCSALRIGRHGLTDCGRETEERLDADRAGTAGEEV